MTVVQWDGGDGQSKKFSSPFTKVSIAADQVGVVLDGGSPMGTLMVGVYSPDNAPALASATAELHLIVKRPSEGSFGSKGMPLPAGGLMEGTIQHFGRWRYQVSNPERYAQAAANGDPIKAAGQRIGELFDACAIEWISGGHMQVTDLAANAEKFRQVLPPHIEKAVEDWGLMFLGLDDFQANVEPA